MKYIELGLELLGALSTIATIAGTLLPASRFPKAKDFLLHLGTNLKGAKDTITKKAGE